MDKLKKQSRRFFNTITGRTITFMVIVLFVVCVIYASEPSTTILQTNTTTLASGSSATITYADLTLSGDSLGIAVNLNKDTILGWITYQYVTADGQSNTGLNGSQTFTMSDGQNHFHTDGGNYGAFTQSIVRAAGTPKANIYLILKNNSANSVSIQSKLYSVIWR